MEDVGLVKAPRICKMVRGENGYGFNLHGEKGVVGQYISAVDAGGAADQSGLCVGDRVVEVNGINVEAMPHAEVVSQIRSDPTQTTLLVVDKITDNYLKKIGRPVTSSLANYSSVHEIKISDTEQLAGLRISEPEEEDGGPHDNSIKIERSQPPPPPVTTSPPDTPPYRKESIENEEVENDKSSVKENNARNIEEQVAVQTSKENLTGDSKNIMDGDDSEANHKQKNSTDATLLSRKTSIPKSTPKRKEVKTTTTDWKSKLNMFDNL